MCFNHSYIKHHKSIKQYVKLNLLGKPSPIQYYKSIIMTKDIARRKYRNTWWPFFLWHCGVTTASLWANNEVSPNKCTRRIHFIAIVISDIQLFVWSSTEGRWIWGVLIIIVHALLCLSSGVDNLFENLRQNVSIILIPTY